MAYSSFDRVGIDRAERLSSTQLCYYVNATQHIQMVRLTTSLERFERLVFPRQRWLFEASPEAWLEVGSAADARPERISCQTLQVKQGSSLVGQ